MTVVAAHEPLPAEVDETRDPLAGLGVLVRFMLRADRVKLPMWAGGLGVFALYVSIAVPAAYGDDVAAATQLFNGPVGRMLTGPGYGLSDPTVERLIAGGYGLYLMLVAALMSIFLVVRHTRVEEQTGRAELVRASVVGRHAGLVAALIVATITNLVAGLAVFVALVAVGGFALIGSALLASSVVGVGLAFAGIAAAAAQLSEYSRAASGLAGGVLAAAFVVRGGGDMPEEGGTLLSWFSPLGWAQQTAPYVLDRWWPLVLLAVTGLVAAALGLVLSSRRDHGASFVPVRPGPPRARPSLGTPWGFSLRLQRASILAWTASLVVFGFVMGLFAEAMLDAADDLPEVIRELFGERDVVNGYLAVMATLMAVFVAIYAALAVQNLRSEETSGRGEALLATPMSRAGWLALTLGVTVVGVTIVSAVVGFASGLGAALTTGESGFVVDVTLAQLNTVPAVLVILGLAALLFGAWPRALPLTWGVVGYGFFAETFGELLDLPQLAADLNPFGHVAQIPLEPFAAVPVVVLTVLAAALGTTGVVLLGRREYAAV